MDEFISPQTEYEFLKLCMEEFDRIKTLLVKTGIDIEWEILNNEMHLHCTPVDCGVEFELFMVFPHDNGRDLEGAYLNVAVTAPIPGSDETSEIFLVREKEGWKLIRNYADAAKLLNELGKELKLTASPGDKICCRKMEQGQVEEIVLTMIKHVRPYLTLTQT